MMYKLLHDQRWSYSTLLRCVMVVVCLNSAGFSHASPPISEPEIPAIANHHRQFLTRLARRTIRDVVLGRDQYQPEYIPSALNKLNVEVVVRLRRSGYLLAMTSAGYSPVALAVRDAAHNAMELIAKTMDEARDLLPHILIEIEIVGPPQALSISFDWTTPQVIDEYIEPGVHGVVLMGPTIKHRFCPTEIFTSNRILSQALKDIATKTHSAQTQLVKTRLMRFRTLHWIQEHPDTPIINLLRGMTTIAQAAITRENLDHAIDRLAEYMVYRQLDTGLFTYEYEPATNQYSNENNLLRQIGASLAMAVHATWSGAAASSAAADMGIRYHLQGLTDLPHLDRASFIATADQSNKLGVSALLCLAMTEHPQSQQFTDEIERLVNGMLWLQRPSGMFVTTFPPAEEIKSQNYFPGEALLAMASQFRRQPSARIADAFDRAINFYRDYFRKHRSTTFAPFQISAFSIMAKRTKRSDYAEYVFELADWLADKQLNASNSRYPQLWGGISGNESNHVGVSTTSYLNAIADALSLAKAVDDSKRVQRYEQVVRLAARFVIQLQIRPHEAYFIRSPQDAVGGIRATPSWPRLRIDHCQHALMALIKARQVLYPE